MSKTKLLDCLLGVIIYCFIAIYGGYNLQSLLIAAFGLWWPLTATLVIAALLLAVLYFWLLPRADEGTLVYKALIIAAGVLISLRAPNVKNISFGITAAFIAVFFIWCMADLFRAFRAFRGRRKHNFAVIAVILNLTAIVHVSNSHIVYFWDTAGFWQQAAEQSALLFGDIRTFGQNILYSLNFRDYNLFPAILPTLTARLFGPSRLIFVLTVINLYTLPAIYVLGKFGKSNLAVLLAFLCLPMLGGLGSIGFLDAGGLIFCGLALLLYTKRESTAAFGAIGFLLAGMFLFRRWYLFWAISFIICAVIHQLILWAKREQTLGTGAKNMAVMGLSFFIPLTTFLHPLVTNRLLGGFSAELAAYLRPLAQDLRSFLIWFGVFPSVLLILFTILLILRGKYLAIFLTSHALLTFILFRTIQGHGQQHLLLYAPMFFIILAMGFGELGKILKSRVKSTRTLTAIALAAIILTGFSYVAPFVRPYYIGEVRPFYPGFTLRTRNRHDLAELLRLTEHLDRLSDNGNNIIGLVASSLMFNGDILRNVEMSINAPIDEPRNFIADYSQVDSRDGVPRYLFFVPYVVVADPVQLHMPPQEQTLVTIAHSMFINGTSIGAAFERLPETYSLDDGITVYIFRKARGITQEEEDLFEAMFAHIGDRLKN